MSFKKLVESYLYEQESVDADDFVIGDTVENEWGDLGTRYGVVKGVRPTPGVDQWVTVQFMDGSRDTVQGDSLIKISQDEYDDAVAKIHETNPQPEDDDIFFGTESVSAGGKFLGKFVETDDAEKAVVAWINKNKWSPNMWSVSDHGNVSPYKLSPENAALIKM